MTKDQITALLLGLFGASGPIGRILGRLLHLDTATVADVLDVCTLLTPAIAGAIFAYLQRPSAAVTSVAALPPAQQAAALSQVSDATKVKIAEAVPGVATVVVKDTATNGLATLAQDETHPNVVTETQNEIDAKKGTKTP